MRKADKKGYKEVDRTEIVIVNGKEYGMEQVKYHQIWDCSQGKLIDARFIRKTNICLRYSVSVEYDYRDFLQPVKVYFNTLKEAVDFTNDVLNGDYKNYIIRGISIRKVNDTCDRRY